MSVKQQKQQPYRYQYVNIDISEHQNPITINLNSCIENVKFAASIILPIASWIVVWTLFGIWLHSERLVYIIIAASIAYLWIILHIILIKCTGQKQGYPYNYREFSEDHDPFKYLYEYVKSDNFIENSEGRFYCGILDEYSFIDKQQFFMNQDRIGMVRFNVHFHGIRYGEIVRKMRYQ